MTATLDDRYAKCCYLDDLPAGYEPTRFKYRVSKDLTRVSLGTPDKYEYDWFLGGVDTCQVGNLFPYTCHSSFSGRFRWTTLEKSESKLYLIGALIM